MLFISKFMFSMQVLTFKASANAWQKPQQDQGWYLDPLRGLLCLMLFKSASCVFMNDETLLRQTNCSRKQDFDEEKKSTMSFSFSKIFNHPPRTWKKLARCDMVPHAATEANKRHALAPSSPMPFWTKFMFTMEVLTFKASANAWRDSQIKASVYLDLNHLDGSKPDISGRVQNCLD